MNNKNEWKTEGNRQTCQQHKPRTNNQPRKQSKHRGNNKDEGKPKPRNIKIKEHLKRRKSVTWPPEDERYHRHSAAVAYDWNPE
eukprot:1140446-Pyramimonas_sp.AAC.1